MSLRKAAQQALEALEKEPEGFSDWLSTMKAARTALRVALAETTSQESRQAEPVAWLDPWTQANVTTDYDAYGKYGIPLYTAPPKRKPLTEEQIKRLYDLLPSKYTLAMFARAIERAHGIGGEE